MTRHHEKYFFRFWLIAFIRKNEIKKYLNGFWEGAKKDQARPSSMNSLTTTEAFE